MQNLQRKSKFIHQFENKYNTILCPEFYLSLKKSPPLGKIVTVISFNVFLKNYFKIGFTQSQSLQKFL